jgi:hypothetical protein
MNGSKPKKNINPPITDPETKKDVKIIPEHNARLDVGVK